MTERQYKDSGIDWIGEIPNRWKTTRIKFIGETKSGDEIRKESILDHGEYPVYGGGKKIGFCNDYNANSNDILIGRVGSCGKINLPKQKAWATDNAIILRTKSNFNYQFLAYCLKCVPLEIMITQTAQPLLTATSILNCNVPRIALQEQQQIADFLDSKTASINSAIQAQKDIIEKLKEYKKAVITEAVTKGLNRDGEMKKIDFLWIHEFPKNWGIYKLNHLLDYNHPYPLGDGDHGSIKAKDYATCGIPLLRVQNLGYAESINTDNLVYISKAQNETIKNSTLHPDDILFAKTGATIGKTAILTDDTPIANTTSHVGKITVNKKKFFPRYVYYFLSSEIGIFQLWDIAGKKATRPEVGLDEVKYIKFLIPNSIAEQKAIADYLDAQCNRITNAIFRCNDIIEKLEEYKKSIIYNAVTGKIDCRKDVIPE